MKHKTAYPPKPKTIYVPPYVPPFLTGSFAFPEDTRSTVLNWL